MAGVIRLPSLGAGGGGVWSADPAPGLRALLRPVLSCSFCSCHCKPDGTCPEALSSSFHKAAKPKLMKFPHPEQTKADSFLICFDHHILLIYCIMAIIMVHCFTICNPGLACLQFQIFSCPKQYLAKYLHVLKCTWPNTFMSSKVLGQIFSGPQKYLSKYFLRGSKYVRQHIDRVRILPYARA